jgi:sugar lactone lactonase YvrE
MTFIPGATMNPIPRTIPLALAILLTAATSQAVRPQSWNFLTQKDFAQGKFDNTVVDSYGQLTLGREVTPIPAAHSAQMVAAFAQTSDGALYVATNPEPKIFRIDADKSTVVYAAPKGFADITAMTADAKGNLLVALSGKKARLVQLNPTDKTPAPVTKFENENVTYIWAIATAPDGTTYLGTGPHGKVYKLGPAEGTTVLETTAKNVMALAFDKPGNLIVGTDAKGLVFRVDAKTQKPFVLLDAGNVDVNAILADHSGNLYVATAKADENAGSGDKDQSDIEEPDTRSTPGAVDPEPVQPPDNGNADQGRGPAHFIPGILADNHPALPPDLKALLQHVATQQKDSPATQHGSGRIPPHPPGSHPGTTHRVNPGADDEDEQPAVSALYRISPTGAVTTLMQEPDMNYSLLLAGDDLLIGTGHEGKLYRYRRADQSTTLIARLKEEMITALFAAKPATGGADKAGDVLIGTANPGHVYRLAPTLAKKGTFTSQVLDARHTANWGAAALQGIPTLPPGTRITIATRTGNLHDVSGENAKFWSDWSPESDPAAHDKITSPPARFLQFRVTLTADDPGQTPIAAGLRVAYQTENLPPKIKAVAIETPTADTDADDSPDTPDHSTDADAPPKIARVEWDAADPNNDTLEFRLLYRPVSATKSDAPWTPLAKHIKDSSYDWDTRALPDGQYQVKVIASDKPDNTAGDAKETARVSPPITIDHTPPTFGQLKAGTDGDKKDVASISGDATDPLSPITDIRYQIDGQGDWQPASPADKMFDSLHESFTIVTAPLSAESHRITVRATDAQGNSGYKTVTVAIKP